MTVTRDRRALSRQIRDGILDLIANEQLQVGDRLPTEADLAARFDVARTTVRESLKLLEQDAIIGVRRGLGRFVIAPPTVHWPITELESVTRMMADLGYTVTNRVLKVDVRPATKAEAEALQLDEGQLVISLERVRLKGDEPLIISRDVVPRAVITAPLDGIDWAGSLQRILGSQGSPFAVAHAHIRAAMLPDDLVAQLADDGHPWLLMVQTNLTETGRPVIYSHDYHRGDLFDFYVLRRRNSSD